MESEYTEALKKAAHYCSKQERCKADMYKKLHDWEISEELHDDIIQELESEQFIDEKRYAQFFTKEKFKFNRWGKGKIRYALYQKGIPPEYTETGLKHIDAEQYEETLWELLEKKDESLQEEDMMKRKSKLIRYASGKGYEQDIVYNLVDKILEQNQI